MIEVIDIQCDLDTIIFQLIQKPLEKVIIKVFSPNIVAAKQIETLIIEDTSKCKIQIPRYFGNYDGLYLRYEYDGDGPRFVTKILHSNVIDYFGKESKKGLRCVNIEDGLNLGIKHTVLDLPIQTLLANFDFGDSSTYQNQGVNYFVNNITLKTLDDQITSYTKNKINVIINILVCAPVGPPLDTIIEHPKYDKQGKMSAINVTSDESCLYLEAACDFLAERYSDPNERLISGLILANEISAAFIWANAGDLSCQDYMYEYTRALRIAWQAGCKYQQNWRVFISLDNRWNYILQSYSGTTLVAGMYKGKDCLQYLNDFAYKEGDFNWNIAYHPYAYSLRDPDFYNDQKSINSFDTPTISFKNLIVLVQAVRKLYSKWKGSFRKIILSEQGFDSHNDKNLEYIQATAYGKAYKEIMKYPEIESFIYHSHCDNLGEELGLKLGLRRSNDFDKDNKKVIYELFKHIEDITYDGKKLYEHF